MKKLKTWQVVLLVIFYPIGICVLIYRILKKIYLKKKREEADRVQKEQEERKAAEREARYAADRAAREAELASREMFTFKVVGVTFKNEDGGNRQTLLRKLKFGEKPFDDEDGVTIEIERAEYEGNPAFCVYVENHQVGNIGKDDIPFFVDRFRDLIGVSGYSLSGGGTDDEGHPIYYGISIDCVFRKRT